MPVLTDPYQRKIDYLRVSITDRCNLRCIYCMPEEGIQPKPHGEILTYEEIEFFARCAVKVGISKIRLTGGEPLVRKGIVELVRRLSQIPDLRDVSLTTNGILLKDYAKALAEVGLKRVNIGLNSLEPGIYHRLTRGGDVRKALEGMTAALKVGLDPVKINVVVLRGLNEDLAKFATLIFEYPVHVRFIEYMPFNQELDGDRFVPCTEMMERFKVFGKLEEVSSPLGAGPAKYYTLKGARGTLGFISPISSHFCSNCNRLRLTADGQLRTCLFSDEEIDVKTVLRQGASEQKVIELIREALVNKPKDRISIRETSLKRRMSQIGG